MERLGRSRGIAFGFLLCLCVDGVVGAEHPAECGPLQVPTCGGTPGPETFSHVSVRVAGHEGRGQLSARERSRTPGFGQKTFLSSPRTSRRPLLQSPPASETGPLQQSSRPPTPSCPGGTHQSAAAAHSCDASGTDCSAMTTARYRPTWDLALDPLVSCKLCLGEYPVEQMTTIAQCQCIFCTLCLKQYVELLIKEGLETAISCPDAACPKQGHLQEDEIECMVAAEIMQRYKKLQFERESVCKLGEGQGDRARENPKQAPC
ncbi:E3 ubiquitin-protein ligase RNF144A isoform X4 [Panthera pardus]|uniref:RBR-type E3 ubiquitin transferase n=1 Tax=Panthera pardus TaxID=9691 RepID=A0A9W2UKX5_PANPR|nr:E3 ubiquitin-protein ligase RNF144A isoform X4 [Panthera pardus]